MNQYLEFLRWELWPYLASRDRKPLRQQWREARALSTKYRCIPYHYLKHRLYERSARADFIDYVPARLVQRFRQDRNPRALVHMLSDKVETVRILSRAGIRCVQTLFSVSVDGVIHRGDGAVVEADAAADALRRMGGQLFVKPIDSRAGLGAFRIDAADVDAVWVSSMRNVVIQQVLRNHPLIEALHPGEFKTVRVVTFVEDGHCTTIASLLKVGQGKAVVDNWGQGSIAIGIDLASGMLNQSGITKAKYGRQVHEAHPDTGVRFASVTLPCWRETLELAERAALNLQPHVTIGFDIGITADGPVLVEANEAADAFALQEICGPVGGTVLGQRVLAHWLRTRGSRPTAQ